MSEDYQSARSDLAQIPVGDQDNAVERPEPVRLQATELSIRYRSKLELYGFLTKNAGVYLPPPRYVTTYFIKDLFAGRKTRKYHCFSSH